MNVFKILNNKRKELKAKLKSREEEKIMVQKKELENMMKEKKELEKKAKFQAEYNMTKEQYNRLKNPTLYKIADGIKENMKKNKKKRKDLFGGSGLDFSKPGKQPKF